MFLVILITVMMMVITVMMEFRNVMNPLPAKHSISFLL